MVIPDWTDAPRPPEINVELQPHGGHLPLARPLDRLAATIVDVFVLLVPVFILLSAPLKRMFTTSFILGSEADFVASVLAMTLLGTFVVMAYQSITHTLWGATLGKKIFRLRVVSMFPDRQLTFFDHVVRSSVWVFEVTCCGLPWLAVFSNQKRRPWHDRICDSVVVHEGRSGSVAPTSIERSLVNGVFVAATILTFILFAVQLRGIVEKLKDEKALNLGAGDLGSCEVVEHQADESEGEHSRLKMAMTLYAAGLADRSCLESEVEREVANQTPVGPMTYLSQAFIYADDAEISNAYLDEVCAVAPETVECAMSQLVTNWSNDDWAAVEEVLKTSPVGSGFLEIWGVRHYMKQAQYESALKKLDELNRVKAVAEFSMVQRVKALFNSFKSSEAAVALSQATLTLPEGEALELSSWVCAQELQKGCGAMESLACKTIANQSEQHEIDFEEPTLALAQVLSLECKGTHSVDYLSFGEAVRNSDWQNFFRANVKRQKEDRSAAAELFSKVIDSESTPDLLRLESIRRWSQFADGEQLNRLVRMWQDIPSKEIWVKSGNILITRLSEANPKLALKVARYLLNVQSISPESAVLLNGLIESGPSLRAPASVKIKEQVKQLLDSVEEDN